MRGICGSVVQEVNYTPRSAKARLDSKDGRMDGLAYLAPFPSPDDCQR